MTKSTTPDPKSFSSKALHTIVVAVGLSIACHGVGFYGLTALAPKLALKRHEKMQMKIKEEKKAPTPAPEESKIPPKPKPTEKKPKPKKVPTQAPKKVDNPPEKVIPIQGINPDAMVKDGKGMAAPVGNTLLMEDEGKRLKPEQVGALQEDCTSDARALTDTFIKPEYTADAVDGGLEGSFVVDVFVDGTGMVKEAELRHKIGYGMDERVLSAAKNTKFTPRKNRVCGFIAGWAEIKIVLTLP